MQVDSEFTGILVALGFVLLAIVGIPLAKWFVLGAALMGFWWRSSCGLPEDNHCYRDRITGSCRFDKHLFDHKMKATNCHETHTRDVS